MSCEGMHLRQLLVAITLTGAVLFAVLEGSCSFAQEANLTGREKPRMDILSPTEWQEIRDSSDRALEWLASQQQPDGSFKSSDLGQPAVTSLCTLAFLANGHMPGEGQYGDVLNRSVAYVMSKQKSNGLIAVHGPSGPLVRHRRGSIQDRVGVTATYNHAISGLMLSEVYGMTSEHLGEDRLKTTIEKGVELSLNWQNWPKPRQVDEGGWRYVIERGGVEADLSVVGWHLKLLRSAKNAGFDVPDEAIEEAVGFVLRCFDKEHQTFEYEISSDDRRSRAMAGVGIIALAHSSQHDRPEAMAAADFILKQGFLQYNRYIHYYTDRHTSDRYHYGVFYCTMAMYQIGGRHWAEYYPPTSRVLLDHQNRNGSWPVESHRDEAYGQTYTTALVVLALGAPNQLLPIYQR